MDRRKSGVKVLMGGGVLMRRQGMKEKRWRKRRRSWGRKEGRRIKKLMKKAENCRFLEEYG